VVEYVTNPGQTLPAAELLNAAEQAAAAAAGVTGAAGTAGATPPPSSVLPAGTSTLGIPGAR
jgi:hypothetical protein